MARNLQKSKKLKTGLISKNMEVVLQYLDELSVRTPPMPEYGSRKRIGYKPDGE